MQVLGHYVIIYMKGVIDIETKICVKCKRELTLDNFYKTKRNRDGLAGECKSCSSEYNKQYRNCPGKREKIADQSRKYNEVNKVSIAKKVSEYYDEHKEETSEYQKQYRKDNREYISNHDKKYYLDNKESIDEYHRKYYLDNKDSVNERIGKYQQSNQDSIIKWRKQYYLEHKIVHAARSKRYRENNRERCNTMTQKYIAKKRALPNTLTNEQWEEIKLHFDNKCCYCGQANPLAREHFMSMSKGGEFTTNNVLPSCQPCNSSKGVASFFEWYPKYRYYSKKREKAILSHLGYKNSIQQLASTV